MNKQKEIKVEIGGESVVIDKLFGPTVFMDLRITPSSNTCEWIIERRTILPCPDPDPTYHTDSWQTWVEWCRIPGQFPWEFEKE